MTADDGRIVLDVIAATLLLRALRLIAMKAFIEPLAFWAGRRGYHALDWILGDRLPDLK
jgi:hypothetical protein